MNLPPRNTIEKIHATDTMMVLSVTGAGSSAINCLLSVSGASRTGLEALIPYSSTSLMEMTGIQTQGAVSEVTATKMAEWSYFRASHLRELTKEILGVSCTAAISTDRERKGDNNAYVSIWGSSATSCAHLHMKKGLRTRQQEETLVSELIIAEIADFIFPNLSIKTRISDEDILKRTKKEFSSPFDALIGEQIRSFLVTESGEMLQDAKFSGGILSGSFNPVHRGHIELANKASQILDREIAFEISAANVDKPPLESAEIQERTTQFKGKANVLVSMAPLFSQKSALYPNSSFVIGYDTARRLVDPKYYGNNKKVLFASLQEIKSNNCNFLVAGRVDNGSFKGLDELEVPSPFKDMLIGIPETTFRVDQSSSEIRNKGD